jgi:hypothetical protein
MMWQVIKNLTLLAGIGFGLWCTQFLPTNVVISFWGLLISVQVYGVMLETKKKAGEIKWQLPMRVNIGQRAKTLLN